MPRVDRRAEKFLTKIQINLEVDDIEGLDLALKKVRDFYLKKRKDKFFDVSPKLKLRIEREEIPEELKSYWFEREKRGGEEVILLILPSKMNSEK